MASYPPLLVIPLCLLSDVTETACGRVRSLAQNYMKVEGATAIANVLPQTQIKELKCASPPKTLIAPEGDTAYYPHLLAFLYLLLKPATDDPVTAKSKQRGYEAVSPSGAIRYISWEGRHT